MDGLHLKHSSEFFEAILDSMGESIVVIDREGGILYTNRAWLEFGIANGLGAPQWVGQNYLDACRPALADDVWAQQAVEAIEEVISGEKTISYLEYPCHSPTEQRWFTMRIKPFDELANTFLISHQNITERKLIENKIRELTLIDELTGVANRRHFDKFLDDEWRRAIRERNPVSLILVDIDHFKQFNDRYGHQAGDKLLNEFGSIAKRACQRPGDLCARYGGEEFAFILGNTPAKPSERLAQALLKAIREANFDYEIVTASAGLASMYPQIGSAELDLIAAADQALYQAKERGRDQLCLAASFAAEATVTS